MNLFTLSFVGHYPSCFTVMIADLELGIADELLIAIRSASVWFGLRGLLEWSRILTHMHRRTPSVGHLHNKLLWKSFNLFWNGERCLSLSKPTSLKRIHCQNELKDVFWCQRELCITSATLYYTWCCPSCGISVLGDVIKTLPLVV